MKPGMVKWALGWSAAVATLLAVFSLYSHPYLLVKLADHLWACF